MKCNETIERLVRHGALKWKVFDKCPHDAKFKCSYRRGTDGKMIERNLCGKHTTNIKKSVEKFKPQWDAKLTVVPL